MRGWRVLAGSAAACVLAACSPASPREVSQDTARAPGATRSSPKSEQVLVIWRAHLDSVATAVATLDTLVRGAATAPGLARAQVAFRHARERYKRAEVALEYYAPSTARAMNGPPVPEVEETEGPETVLAPSGFQVIEALLFANEGAPAIAALVSETETLRALVTRAQRMMDAQHTTDAHVWDAARLEINRVLVLGLAGFDAPESGDALPEAAAALDGVARTLAPYAAPHTAHRTDVAALTATVAEARRALTDIPAGTHLDYLHFVAQHGQPVAHALVRARNAAAIGVPSERRAFRMSAASVFDTNAIDVDAFAPLGLDRAPAARVALGHALFADTRLSGNQSRSCATCHIPARAFTDGRARALGLRGESLARNTPTMLNVGAQVGHFADLRTTYLEDQIAEVIGNPLEMHGHLETAATLLNRDAATQAQFRAAFPAERTTPSETLTVVTPLRIRQAIAAYLRSLTRFDAPIDRALRGDSTALSADARAGLSLYMGKARCGSCHFLPLTSGTVPPMYQRSELEVIGVPRALATRAATIDTDAGRFAVSRAAPHRHAFRTPSLRNVAHTAPYMHNGVYQTLDQVIDFYDRGGGAGIGASVPNQTLPTTPLKLSAREKQQLRALLEAFTDSGARDALTR